MLHSFVLQRGYVETTSFSVILLHHAQGFNTIKDAILSIREALNEVLEQENKEREKNRKRYPTYDQQDLSMGDFVWHWWGADLQSCHSDLCEALDVRGWVVFPSKEAFQWDKQVLIEQAEMLLTDDEYLDNLEE